MTFTLKKRPHFSPAEFLVLADSAVSPAPAVVASTEISARLKRVPEHSSHMSIVQWQYCQYVLMSTRGNIAALREFWTDWLPTETPFEPKG